MRAKMNWVVSADAIAIAFCGGEACDLTSSLLVRPAYKLHRALPHEY
jgi:hypothetical protein